MNYEEKIRKATEEKARRSEDLNRKYNEVRSMFINIYDEDLCTVTKRIEDPRWINNEKVKMAAKIKNQFEKAKTENEKIYDEAVEKAKEEEKEEIQFLLDDLTDDWYISDEDDDEDEDDWDDDDEDDWDDNVEVI